MKSPAFSPGDLVTFIPWECEGIEMPFGVNLGKRGSRPAAIARTPIQTGSIGLVIERLETDHIVLVGGKVLLVMNEFLVPLNNDQPTPT